MRFDIFSLLPTLEDDLAQELLARVAVRVFTNTSLPDQYTRADLMDTCHHVINSVNGKVFMAEQEDLTHQGMGQSFGVVVAMGACHLLGKVAITGASSCAAPLLMGERLAQLGNTKITYKVLSDTTWLKQLLTTWRSTVLP